ncbi:MAG: hypothetical protein ABH879_09730 [archaeon]
MIKIDIRDQYRADIYGFGEIYEIVSVNYLLQKLRARYAGGDLYLFDGSDVRYTGLRDYLIMGEIPFEEGTADRPPWKPKTRTHQRPVTAYPAVRDLAALAFRLLVRLEFLWSQAHLRYVFTAMPVAYMPVADVPVADMPVRGLS